MATIINIVKGGKPVDFAVIDRAREREMIRRGYASADREEMLLTGMLSGGTDPEFQAAMAELAQFKADVSETKAVNAFNHELVAYRKAVARLAQVQLSVGQDGITLMPVEDGEPVEVIHQTQEAFDDSVAEGQEVVQPFKAPLVGGTVEVPVYDDEGNQTGTEEQPDEVQKQIDQDEAERAVAQAVVDNTKQEVKDF